MTPNEQGAFCGSCCKTVVDFTRKTSSEIKDFFTQAAGQKICGRFERSQLQPVPVKVSPQRKQLFARFALALYMVFGSLLFTSCGSTEQPVGKVVPHERMGDVEPVHLDTGLVKPTTDTTSKQQQEPDPHIKGNIKQTGTTTATPKPVCEPEKLMGKPAVLMGDVMETPEQPDNK